NATTVQLLGTIDDLVSPDDNIDLISGRDFIYLEVPHSGHANVIEMGADNRHPERARLAAERRAALIKAMNVDKTDLNTSLSPVDSSVTVRNDVSDVVFVIHGIRDEGYWTRKIAYHVQLEGQKLGRTVATETSTYGYFPMLPFLRPGAREEKVQWLMDRYTEARARYPRAQRFHYVGHSNGTYLLTKALEESPAVHFDQVVFAGSVVRRDYSWDRFIPRRVKGVLNFVATADWVVAFFPNAL